MPFIFTLNSHILNAVSALKSCSHNCQSVFLCCSRKTWGIENFVSSTLLRNMREKDLRKAISYHMKKSQSQNDPKQKGLSVDQTRINYLEELSDLKSFGGKSFSATMMVGFFNCSLYMFIYLLLRCGCLKFESSHCLQFFLIRLSVQ